MGDGGFWHNGLTSGIANAVFNKHDKCTIIVDNGYSAATGGQDILSSNADRTAARHEHPIETAVRGVGVKWVRRIVDLRYEADTARSLKEAMTTTFTGPKVVIAEGECQLNRQRRIAPALRQHERRAGVSCVSVSASTRPSAPATIRASGSPAVRR